VGTVDPRTALGRVWVQLSSPMQDSGEELELYVPLGPGMDLTRSDLKNWAQIQRIQTTHKDPAFY